MVIDRSENLKKLIVFLLEKKLTGRLKEEVGIISVSYYQISIATNKIMKMYIE